MSHFLEKIKSSVMQRVAHLPELGFIKPVELDFKDIFKRSSPTILAEIKLASPSLGRIYHGNLDPVAIAKEYITAGAAALSVLTEPHYFDGNMVYLQEIRAAFPDVHLLLKDFVISKKQIAEGCRYGANAVLLIVALLDYSTLKALYEYAISLGMTPIIEVHDKDELEIALALSPAIIGVNNRDLTTLQVHLDTSKALIPYIPDDCFAICESGIENNAQMMTMLALGFDGCLVGSSLMSTNTPGYALQTLLREETHEG